MTLAIYRDCLAFRRVDRSCDTAKAAGARCRMSISALGGPATVPDTEAIRFYLMNHVVAEISRHYHENEPLPDEIEDLVNEYAHCCGEMAARMFYYLAMICTREARHVRDKASFYPKIYAKFGQEIGDFFSSLAGLSGKDAAGRFKSSAPNSSLGQYTRALVYTFNNGLFTSSYGGLAWGEVARVLDNFVQGSISAEMMLDTGFTLAHNTGPIFNKGMLYRKQTSIFRVILDVQRAGMIPNLVFEANYLGKDWTGGGIPEASGLYFTKALNAFKEFLNIDFGGYVDWYVVQELGALGSYQSQQATQEQMYGPASQSKELIAKQVANQAAKAAAMAKALSYKLPLAPGLVVKKVEREDV